MTSRRRDILVSVLWVSLAACGRSAPVAKDGATLDAMGEGKDSADVAVEADADAQTDFVCTDGGGGACNDNPIVSSIWGVCGADGRCQCKPGFVLNPATGKCRPASVADAGDG